MVCHVQFLKARKEKTIQAVAQLVGDFEELDKASLAGLGPIRVKVATKDPSQIKGTSRVYFNGRGFMISWLVEAEKNKDPKKPLKEKAKESDTEEEEEEGDDDHYMEDTVYPSQEEGDHDGAGQPPESSKHGENRSRHKTSQADASPQDNEDSKQEKDGVSTKPNQLIPSGGKEILTSMGSQCMMEQEAVEVITELDGPIVTQSQEETQQLTMTKSNNEEKTQSDMKDSEQAEVIRTGGGTGTNSWFPVQAERKCTRLEGRATPALDRASKVKARNNLQGDLSGGGDAEAMDIYGDGGTSTEGGNASATGGGTASMIISA